MELMSLRRDFFEALGTTKGKIDRYFVDYIANTKMLLLSTL